MISSILSLAGYHTGTAFVAKGLRRVRKRKSKRERERVESQASGINRGRLVFERLSESADFLTLFYQKSVDTWQEIKFLFSYSFLVWQE